MSRTKQPSLSTVQDVLGYERGYTVGEVAHLLRMDTNAAKDMCRQLYNLKLATCYTGAQDLYKLKQYTPVVGAGAAL